MKRWFVWACAIVWAGAAESEAKPVAPDWLKGLAAAPVPAFAAQAKAVVLLDQATEKVSVDGKIVTTTAGAIRVLKTDGRSAAAVKFAFNDESERVTGIDGWLISPAGVVKTYTRKEAIDGAADPDAVYTDARWMLLSAEEEAVAGSVFGYVFTMEEHSIFSQRQWRFQGELPVVDSRFAVELPPGWSARSTTFHHEDVKPRIEGQRSTWELRDLPAVETEPLGPSVIRQAAALGVDLQFPVGGKIRVPFRSFASWQDVSAFVVELQDSRAVPDATVSAKAAEIIAGAATSWEKIRAITRFVQSVNYASIQLGSGRGGGYTPNPAAQVLRRNYGDCKDKTILMRALLAAAGLKSYSTIAYWGDRLAVTDQWPSPQQFNHCIVAVAADESVQSPAVIDHPDLGRLLIVDPTDDATAPGSLDYDHQGSLVLIGAGTPHDLVRVPVAPAADNRLVRRFEASMDATGAIVASVTENFMGQEAARARREYRQSANQADFAHMIERWVSYGTRTAHVTRVAPDDRAAAGEFSLTVEFKAPAYAQTMHGQLLVFKPAVLGRHSQQPLTAKTRTLPVILEPGAFEETAEMKLPAEFEVDEMGEAVDFVRPWGHYSAGIAVADGVLRYHRALEVHAAEIPVGEYEKVRSFYESILRAEQTPVVLKRR